MVKIIAFPLSKRTHPKVQQLKKISDQIDAIVVDAIVDKQIDPHELAGLLAHRLGALLKGFDDKAKTWDVCTQVAKKQAVLDEA